MLRVMLAATAMSIVLSAPTLAQQEPSSAKWQPLPAESPQTTDGQIGAKTPAMKPGETRAAGQQTPNEQQAARSDRASEEGTFIAQQEGPQVLAAELMNVSVIDAEGNDIGDIEDLIVDPEGGVDGVVVSVGGFLGVGAKDVAVRWSAVEHSPEEQEVKLDVSRADLEAAPDFMTLADIKAEEEAAAAQQMQQGGGGASAPTAPSQ
jgi:sporulation protein YlmC with PRC-barrel domain